MEEMNRPVHPVNPRRRRKTKMQIFKEAYLPVMIAAAALLLILIFIIGAIVRGVGKSRLEKQQSEAAAQQQAQLEALHRDEAAQLMAAAERLAAGYDYDGAIGTLDSFKGDFTKNTQLTQLRDRLVLEQSQLTAWNDPAQIPNLSLQMLIADPQRAFNDDKFSYSFTRNFLTCEEFSAILERLYAGGYVLVNLSDVYTTEVGQDGSEVFTANSIYLPTGKRPLILTQTNVNYHTYLTDSDDDRLPDSGGCGFASKLVFDANGELTNEYVDADDQVLTGAYDMVPILNEFVKNHPDFSYQGSKAVIALTGYDGLFGYRTNPQAERHFGTAEYEQQIASAQAVADKLIQDGYELACYTYENKGYGSFTTAQLEADLNCWITEVAPILENISIFAYAQNSDIADENTLYNDERFTPLTNAGFRIFLGFSASGNTWSVMSDSYVRQGRILLSPTNIHYHADWFGGLLDASQILDSARGQIPT